MVKLDKEIAVLFNPNAFNFDNLSDEDAEKLRKEAISVLDTIVPLMSKNDKYSVAVSLVFQKFAGLISTLEDIHDQEFREEILKAALAYILACFTKVKGVPDDLMGAGQGVKLVDSLYDTINDLIGDHFKERINRN